MSLVVRELLERLGLIWQTTHEDRIEIDREVERATGKNCDEGAKELSEEEFRMLVYRVLARKKKRMEEEAIMYA